MILCLVVFFGLGLLVLFAALAAASWQDRRIAQGKRVDDRQVLRQGSAEPYVPPSWQFTGNDLNDPREDARDTSPE